MIAGGATFECVLAATGARVHVTTVPLLRTDKLGVSQAETDRRIDCLNASIRIVAAVDKIDVIDLAEWVCPDRVCVTRMGSAILRPDGMHSDDAGGPVVAGWLLDQLDWRGESAEQQVTN